MNKRYIDINGRRYTKSHIRKLVEDYFWLRGIHGNWLQDPRYLYRLGRYSVTQTGDQEVTVRNSRGGTIVFLTDGHAVFSTNPQQWFDTISMWDALCN